MTLAPENAASVTRRRTDPNLAEPPRVQNAPASVTMSVILAPRPPMMILADSR